MKVSADFIISLDNEERLLLRDTLDAAVCYFNSLRPKIEQDQDAECDSDRLGSQRLDRVCNEGVSLLKDIVSEFDA